MSDVSSKKIKESFKPILRLSGPDDGVLDDSGSYARIVDSGSNDSGVNGVYVSTSGGGIRGNVKFIVDGGFCVRPYKTGEAGIEKGPESKEGSIIYYGGGTLRLASGASSIEIKGDSVKISTEKFDFGQGSGGTTEFGSGDFKFTKTTIGAEEIYLKPATLSGGSYEEVKGVDFQFADDGLQLKKAAGQKGKAVSAVEFSFQNICTFEKGVKFQDTITVHNGGTGTASVEADRLLANGSFETSKTCRFSLNSVDMKDPSGERVKRTIDYEPVENVLTLQNGVTVKMTDIREGRIQFGEANSLVVPAERVSPNCVLGVVGTDGVIQPVPLSRFDIAKEQGWCRSLKFFAIVASSQKEIQKEVEGDILSVSVWKVDDSVPLPSGQGSFMVESTGDFDVCRFSRQSVLTKQLVSVLVLRGKGGADLPSGGYSVAVVYIPGEPTV